MILKTALLILVRTHNLSVLEAMIGFDFLINKKSHVVLSLLSFPINLQCISRDRRETTVCPVWLSASLRDGLKVRMASR